MQRASDTTPKQTWLSVVEGTGYIGGSGIIAGSGIPRPKNRSVKIGDTVFSKSVPSASNAGG